MSEPHDGRAASGREHPRQMTRAEYEASVCARLSQGVQVPFVDVTLDGWTPHIAGCHDNVDTWVKNHPGCSAVRGWVIHMSFGPWGDGLTAHSVVRTRDGTLIDITPVAEGALRGGLFVEHEGDEVLFFAMKAQGIEMQCLKTQIDPVEMDKFLSMIEPNNEDK
jgi:hypothetical protein